MVGKTIDYSALGQAIDSTWGRSSTPQSAGHSVKFSMLGERLCAVYQAVVNFGTEHERILMRRRFADESTSVLAAEVKRVKATYKEVAGSTLTTKELETFDELEIVGASPHNPRHTALYKRRTFFQLG